MGVNFLLIPVAWLDQPPTEQSSNVATRTDDPSLERLVKAREIHRLRRLRTQDIPADLLGEPGWDMLLFVYISELETIPCTVSSVQAGAQAAPTTGLRWLALLERRGLLERAADKTDKRRTYVRLSAEGRAMMDRVIDRVP